MRRPAKETRLRSARRNSRESRPPLASPVLGRHRAIVVTLALLMTGAVALALATIDKRPDPATTLSTHSAGSATPSSKSRTPTWQRTSYRKIGFDKSFKADLIDELADPPRVVVFGGSRARRLAPSTVTRLTGLSAFNCAVQCFRPEDAYAFSRHLITRAPEAHLNCVIALQTRTFRDDTMRAGLLYDQRLTPAFPAALVRRQKMRLERQGTRDLLGTSRYTARGYLRRNVYDVTRERPGFSYRRHIDLSIRRLLPNHRWSRPLRSARSQAYFERTMQLYNDRGATPLVVLMPIQPRALRAFRAAGYQRNLAALTTYLRNAQTRCDFRVVDCVEVGSFGGSSSEFYDAVHVTRVNADRILARAVADAPECFR